MTRKKFNKFYNSLDENQRNAVNDIMSEQEAERTRHTWTTCILTAVAATTFTMYMFTLNITGFGLNGKGK